MEKLITVEHAVIEKERTQKEAQAKIAKEEQEATSKLNEIK